MKIKTLHFLQKLFFRMSFTWETCFCFSTFTNRRAKSLVLPSKNGLYLFSSNEYVDICVTGNALWQQSTNDSKYWLFDFVTSVCANSVLLARVLTLWTQISHSSTSTVFEYKYEYKYFRTSTSTYFQVQVQVLVLVLAVLVLVLALLDIWQHPS